MSTTTTPGGRPTPPTGPTRPTPRCAGWRCCSRDGPPHRPTRPAHGVVLPLVRVPRPAVGGVRRPPRRCRPGDRLDARPVVDGDVAAVPGSGASPPDPALAGRDGGGSGRNRAVRGVRGLRLPPAAHPARSGYARVNLMAV